MSGATWMVPLWIRLRACGEGAVHRETADDGQIAPENLVGRDVDQRAGRGHAKHPDLTARAGVGERTFEHAGDAGRVHHDVVATRFKGVDPGGLLVIREDGLGRAELGRECQPGGHHVGHHHAGAAAAEALDHQAAHRPGAEDQGAVAGLHGTRCKPHTTQASGSAMAATG